MSTEMLADNNPVQELAGLLQNENEILYQKYNHQVIRSQQLLKRLDDQQHLNDKLQERLIELQRINDRLLERNETLQGKIDVLISNRSHNVSSIQNSFSEKQQEENQIVLSAQLKSSFDIKELVSRWKNFPGQYAKNSPTLHKQVGLLMQLYENQQMPGRELFNNIGLTGITGARYVAALKDFRFIQFSGYRKNGYYFITEEGKSFVEGKEVAL